MVKYKVTFGFGSNTFMAQNFEFCYKHGTEEEFEEDLRRYARIIGAEFLYKEEVNE